MRVTCHHCGATADFPTGHVNRSRAQGLNIYCSRKCSGLGRRKGKTKAQRVAEKRAYDEHYRATNRAILKAKKAAYFQRTYDPVKAAEHRKTRIPYHVEYCRTPAYRAKKTAYDKKRYAKQFGPFADCHTLLMDLETEIASRMTKYEIMLANGTLNKALNRRRQHESLSSF
jgi:hypothetical protein